MQVLQGENSTFVLIGRVLLPLCFLVFCEIRAAEKIHSDGWIVIVLLLLVPKSANSVKRIGQARWMPVITLIVTP